ncbi:hypothetical protein [Spiroplasma endosymbiont of Lonchoptera lutea]|uniref:hypothetical protein n=1 Tax=Spiroplasma endosymbiont of Lonchoptera lutea TaxID=3066297 RepID=UPI0030D4587C
MRKFLSALNLICVMFIFGCSKADVSKSKKDNICNNSCELKFSSLLNITLVVDSGVYFDLSKFDIELPNDVKNQNKNYPNRLPFFMDSQAFLLIKDFFQKYGTFQSIDSKKIYTIPKVVDIVIKLRNLSPYSLIFFSAEMPH